MNGNGSSIRHFAGDVVAVMSVGVTDSQGCCCRCHQACAAAAAAAAGGGGVGAGGVGGQWSLNTLFSKSQRGEKLCQPDTLRVVLIICVTVRTFVCSPSLPLCSLLTYLIGLRCDTLPHCVDNSRRNTPQTFALHPFFVFL